MGLGDLNEKSNNVLWSATWRTGGQKWLDSIEKQKRRISLKDRDKSVTNTQIDRQTDGRTDRVNDKNNRLLG